MEPEPAAPAGSTLFTKILLNTCLPGVDVASRLVGGDIYNFLNAQVTTGAGGFVNIAVAVTLALVFARYLYQRKIFLRV
jgi:hypothetical protein